MELHFEEKPSTWIYDTLGVSPADCIATKLDLNSYQYLFVITHDVSNNNEIALIILRRNQGSNSWKDFSVKGFCRIYQTVSEAIQAAKRVRSMVSTTSLSDSEFSLCMRKISFMDF